MSSTPIGAEMPVRFADVSVIVPAFRNVTTIARTLTSIAAQTLLPREVVVVVDGSDDGTFEAIEAMSSRMRGISLKALQQPNRGAGAARNRALREATGGILAFLDADDEWLPGKLERSLTVMAKTGSNMVSHDYIAVTERKEWYVDCTRHFHRYRDPFVGQFLRGYISSTTVVAERNVVFEVGAFDETLPSGQDYEMWLAMLMRPATRFHMFPEALSRYRVGFRGITGRVEARRRCSMTVIKRYAPVVCARPTGGLGIVAARVVIVHLQATAMHLALWSPAAAIGALARAPIALVQALQGAARSMASRPDFIAGGAPPEPLPISDRSNPFVATRTEVAGAEADRQVRNRLWWERLPMTYVNLRSSSRPPATTEELASFVDDVLNEGPWLRQWFDSHRLDRMRILDLGCGSGVFSNVLTRLGGTVTAVDITETATRLARANADASGLAISIARMDAEKLAFPDDFFDFVFSWGVMHHTANMAQAIAEAARVLKPRGVGLAMVYHRVSIVYYLHGLFWLIIRGKIFRGYTLHTVQDVYTDGYYHRYLTRAEFSTMLADAGLDCEQIVITQYRKKILPLIPASLDRYLKSRFGMCLVTEFRKGDIAEREENRPRSELRHRPWVRKIAAAAAWGWIAAMLTIYLVQFRDLVNPILGMFGLGS